MSLLSEQARMPPIIRSNAHAVTIDGNQRRGRLLDAFQAGPSFLMVGAMLLFPRAMFIPKERVGAGVQARTMANGAAFVMFGLTQLVPNIASATLTLGGFVTSVAALKGGPKRLVPPNVLRECRRGQLVG